jgi:hypothetical protein
MMEDHGQEIRDLRARLQDAIEARDAYVAHVAKLIEERDEARDAHVRAEDTLDRLANSIVAMKAAIWHWSRACPCTCEACKEMTRHAMGEE